MLQVVSNTGLLGTIDLVNGKIECNPDWLRPVVEEALRALKQSPDWWERLDGWSNGIVSIRA